MTVRGWNVLSQQDMESIHEATLTILEKTGVNVGYEPALEAFKKAGARVDGERVYLPRALVEKKVKEAPSEFTLYARNPEKNITIGGDHFITAPGYGAPFVTDWDHKKRTATYADYENFAKLAGASKNLSMTGGVLVEPSDIPDEIRHAKMHYACILYSDKCFMGSSSGAKKAVDSIKMAQILFGPEHSLLEKPALISLINTITPLTLDERQAGGLMEYAKGGQACIVAALSMAGATSPASLAGTLAVQNAEILTGIILAQIVRPGAPVVYGSTSSITEMKYGSLTIGAPETALVTNATAQMAAFYGIPCRAGGGLTDAKCVDAQAGAESMMNLLTASQSGINFVLHAVGILEYYMSMSYEKFIVDDENLGMVLRFRRGIEVNEESLPLEMIHQVGPGGHFLDQEHTFNTFRKEFWKTSIYDRGTYDNWRLSGAPAINEVAHKKCGEILSQYQPPALDSLIDNQLKKFIQNL
ncbi:trimethylamine methyltransferase family protein [Candidatus Formimonas warabiya]|uniref:Methyltransferase n=1 Tax=Formimonas warabiya TaxID=1761012 RepID=A0A3G1KXU2_FORW1|nr:trimethylamine methyltransferase family protein [Candidatus Formimonas warabiya]ATW27261.1 trimethylamine--corrinoid methyltransferase [Candidatus Formimonas warabiya]